jgi:hypothetical protein
MTDTNLSGTGTQKSLPTGDPAVDALIALAGQASQLPAAEHKAVYTQVLDGLERELDADPSAALRGPVS